MVEIVERVTINQLSPWYSIFSGWYTTIKLFFNGSHLVDGMGWNF